MSLTRWQRSIVTEAGDTIAEAEVEVFDAGTTSKPDLFADSGGTTALTNPFNADSSGFAAFYVEGGLYDIAVNGTVIWSDVALGNVRGRNVGTGADDVPDAASFAVTESGVVPEMIGQGAIVDIIENSNGTAVRWESGLQVCFKSDFVLDDVNVSGGKTRMRTEWTFPASFVEKEQSGYITNNGATPDGVDERDLGGARYPQELPRISGTLVDHYLDGEVSAGETMTVSVSMRGYYK